MFYGSCSSAKETATRQFKSAFRFSKEGFFMSIISGGSLESDGSESEQWEERIENLLQTNFLVNKLSSTRRKIVRDWYSILDTNFDEVLGYI